MLKFGVIMEMENGDLLFQNFHVDCECEQKTCQEALLELTIERLNVELKNERSNKTPRSLGHILPY